MINIMGTELSNGQMDLNMRVNFKIIISKAKVNIRGKAGRNMKAILK